MLQIESWDINKPIPYARNARKISQKAIDKVASSIQEFGWQQPLVVDSSNVVIAGHTRLLAAQKLGLKEVPVHVADGLTDGQVKAYRLMDNRSHEEAKWDFEFLVPEMSDLRALCVDLSLTGFDIPEIDELFAKAEASAGLTDPDVCPDTPETPVTVPGDLWLLGRHRLLCGDSTVSTDVDRLLNNLKPHLMVTDPPYGVEYDANWRNEAIKANGKPVGARATGKVNNDGRSDWREAWALFPGNIAYVWHAGKFAGVVQESLEACGLEVRSQIIWAKNNFAISRGDYHWQHEPFWYAVKGTGNWTGDRKQTTLWQIDKPQKSETGHSTQKPIECMRRPIINNSIAGQYIYDPFCGSGTTVIACESEGRSALAIELNPKYVDVIVKRWQDFTGLKAINQETGEEFRS